MEQILVALAIAVLVVLFGGAICGWIAMREISKLRVMVATLQRQVQFMMRRDDPNQVSETTLRSTPITQVEPTKTEVIQPWVATTAKADISTPEPSLPKLPPIKVAYQAPKPKPSPTPKPKTKTPLDLETLLGAKGSVWIGGLALLFGAVFLLRYTIEAGLLTPIMRISVAILMGIVALGLSEWMARRDLKTPVGKALSAKADIPAILAAVGVFTLFGAVYAAHALYGLFGTMPAFLSMAAIALGGMILSLRRGPWLAAIGLVGALAVPLLVASVTPSYIGVFAYVGLITAAALAVARLRDWSWLRAAALVGAAAWLMILLGKAVGGLQFGLWILGVVSVTTLTLRDVLRADGGRQDKEWRWLAWGGIAILTGMAMLAGDDLTPVSYALPFVFALALIFKARGGSADQRWPLLLIGGGLLAATAPFILPNNPELVWPFIAGLVGVSGIFSLVILSVSSRLTSDRGATILTVVGGLIAAAMLIGGLDRVTDYTSELDIWAGFALAGLFAVATLTQTRLAVVRGVIWLAGGLWLVSSVDLSGLPVVSLFYSLGLAGVIALAVISKTGRDDLWVRLAVLLPAAATGYAALIALESSAQYISPTPFLNALWLCFGLPGGIAAVGAVLFRRRRDDLAAQGLFGGAIILALLLIVLLIHHAMNGGDLTATPGFEDYTVQLLVAFAALFGASWLRGGLTDWPKAESEPGRYIVPALAMGASGFSLLAYVTAQLLIFNPLMTSATVIDGHPVFNSLLLGYLAPAILLGAAALRFSGRRPAWFVRTLGALAGVSWLVWTTAQIRRFAQGEVIAMDRIAWGNGELYAVSAVWLLTGIALLLAGLKTGRRDLRLASAGLITLTSLKVFLIDMSALDGAFRAVSFIGLGIVLIGIGRLYQKVLAKPEAA